MATARKKNPQPGGRKSAYQKEFARIAYQHTLIGATDKDLAAAFDVSEQTINTWKKEHPEFLESLKKGKFHADARVGEKLFQRAIGYEHTATKFFTHEGAILSREYTEHYPPDTTAAIFWLKNRQPERWRDKPDVAVTVNNETKVDLSKPPEEWGMAEIEEELRRRGALPTKNGKGHG